MSAREDDGEPDLTAFTQGQLDAAYAELIAAAGASIAAEAGIGHCGFCGASHSASLSHETLADARLQGYLSEPGADGFGEGSVIIDERTGDAGKILAVRPDGSAWVRFPGPGGTDRVVEGADLNLAEDQAWEPEGGWDA